MYVDGTGFYAFIDLPPGSYTVTASKSRLPECHRRPSTSPSARSPATCMSRTSCWAPPPRPRSPASHRAVVAPPGQPAAFSVTAVGSFPLAYQWRFNGATLAGETAHADDSRCARRQCGRLLRPGDQPLRSGLQLRRAAGPHAGDRVGRQQLRPERYSGAGRPTPVAIAAGAWHTLALRADGAVVAWGDNSSGQCDVPPALPGRPGHCRRRLSQPGDPGRRHGRRLGRQRLRPDQRAGGPGQRDRHCRRHLAQRGAAGRWHGGRLGRQQFRPDQPAGRTEQRDGGGRGRQSHPGLEGRRHGRGLGRKHRRGRQRGRAIGRAVGPDERGGHCGRANITAWR